MTPTEEHTQALEALQRLLQVARGHSGQCRYIARFLLGLYHGERFPFDLTDFRCLDSSLFEDCMRVLRMDARHHLQEVHTYFEQGGEIWERLAEDWRVPDILALKIVSQFLLDRVTLPAEYHLQLTQALKRPESASSLVD